METNYNQTSAQEGLASALPPATGSSNINIGLSERMVSALGGAALAVWGLRNLKHASGISMLLSGSYLLIRGFSGYCSVNNLIGRNTAETPKKGSAMEASATFIINKPKSEVYAYWRKLENLPNFMQHLEKVKELDDKRSNWTAKIPGAEKIPGSLGTVSWEAEIVEDVPGEMISWSSLPGSTVDNAGEVRFRETPDNNGTEIKACVSYRLPAGDIGSLAAKLFNPAVEKMMREDLRSFRNVLETATTPSITSGGPGGRESERAESKNELYV
jgi:uncharacterized membrane protein